MLDDTIAGAILGAAITAVGAALIFVIGLIANAVIAARERRRVAFGDVISAYTTYVQAAVRSNAVPTGEVESGLLAASAKLRLALPLRARVVGWWLTGMQNHVYSAAQAPARTTTERQVRQLFLERILANVSNVLLDLHQGRLFLNDITLAAGLFMLEARGVDVATDNPVEYAEADRPRSKGRTDAMSHALFEFFFRLVVVPARWLGLMRSGIELNDDVTVPSDEKTGKSGS